MCGDRQLVATSLAAGRWQPAKSLLGTRVGADREARPWETVGGVGFGTSSGSSSAPRQPSYQKPQKRSDLTADSSEAKVVAEEFNDKAVRLSPLFSCSQRGRLTRRLSSSTAVPSGFSAIRLNPRKTAYLGNRAAAGLKIKSRRCLKQAAEDSVLAYEMDPNYVKAYLRAAQVLSQCFAEYFYAVIWLDLVAASWRPFAPRLTKARLLLPCSEVNFA
eukprot:scaffold90577_cov27-Tisochrysis_lutea.AAC.3